MVFSSSALNKHFAGSVKGSGERYDLWHLPVAGMLHLQFAAPSYLSWSSHAWPRA